MGDQGREYISMPICNITSTYFLLSTGTPIRFLPPSTTKGEANAHTQPRICQGGDDIFFYTSRWNTKGHEVKRREGLFSPWSTGIFVQKRKSRGEEKRNNERKKRKKVSLLYANTEYTWGKQRHVKCSDLIHHKGLKGNYNIGPSVWVKETYQGRHLCEKTKETLRKLCSYKYFRRIRPKQSKGKQRFQIWGHEVN